MKKPERVFPAVAGFFILLVLSCSAPGPDPVSVHRLTDRMIVLACMETNVTAVRTDSGLVIVDTHRSPSAMSLILTRIKKEFHADRMFRVINTHGDADHTSGNQLFPESNIVGQEKCPEYMRQNSAMTPMSGELFDHQLAVIKDKLDSLRTDTREAKRLKSFPPARRNVQKRGLFRRPERGWIDVDR